MSSTPLLFRVLNPTMKAILRSPIHAMVSKRIMILSFKGWKSGDDIETPVSYLRESSTVYCFTHANWWKNIGKGSIVKAVIGGRQYTGLGTAVTDQHELKSDILSRMLTAIPSDARAYGVRLDSENNPIRDDVDKAAANVVMIRIDLQNLDDRLSADQRF